jgi:hypothetical protein
MSFDPAEKPRKKFAKIGKNILPLPGVAGNLPTLLKT